MWRGGAMPDLVGWSQKRVPGHTCPMAKHTHSRRPSKPTKPRAKLSTAKQQKVAELIAAAAVASAKGRKGQQTLPGLPPEVLEDIRHPLHGVDPLQELDRALAAVGINPAHQRQADDFLQDQWVHFCHARTQHAELVALAVEHANDARAAAAARPRTDQEGRRQQDALRALVQATMLLRRNLRLPEGMKDDRKPLRMDEEIIGLVGPDEDARSALVTLKLPQVVIDRLRDAVAAMGGRRTMAGIASLGITMVLDVLEAEHLKHTGSRFPKRPGQVLEGGRPSRTLATTAQRQPRQNTAKKARQGH